MSKWTTSRILIVAACFVVVTIALQATAQTMAPPTAGQQMRPKGENHSAAEQNPACQRIIGECKNLGFIPGQYKQDNGLWKDCFDPVVKGGGNATRDGKPISVPVNPSDVQACRAAVGHRR
jgi:hypothetical protein